MIWFHRGLHLTMFFFLLSIIENVTNQVVNGVPTVISQEPRTFQSQEIYLKMYKYYIQSYMYVCNIKIKKNCISDGGLMLNKF